MSITDILGRCLEVVNFFNNGVITCFRLLWTKLIGFKLFAILGFVWFSISTSLSVARSFCSQIRVLFDGMQSGDLSNLHILGTDGGILAIANTVFPVDETMAFFISWFGVMVGCASIRFIRAAWAAIPFKAS